MLRRYRFIDNGHVIYAEEQAHGFLVFNGEKPFAMDWERFTKKVEPASSFVEPWEVFERVLQRAPILRNFMNEDGIKYDVIAEYMSAPRMRLTISGVNGILGRAMKRGDFCVTGVEGV